MLKTLFFFNVLVVFLNIPTSWCLTFPSPRFQEFPYLELGKLSISQGSSLSRRSILQCGLVCSIPGVALAEAPSSDGKSGLMSTTTVANRLHPIPTFAIVDKKGVPFMVVGEDAKVTGYFFTSYKEADRILKLACSSADKAIGKAKREGKSAEEIGENPWKAARISSVPLDSAMTLVSKSGASFGGGNYFRIAPAEEDIADALALTGQDDLAEGKVPLFYYADFTQTIDSQVRSPVYFRKSELEKQFRRSSRDVEPPQVMVTELLAVLTEMVKPGGTDTDLESLVFVAPQESERKRKECERVGGKEPAFFIGKRIIVL